MQVDIWGNRTAREAQYHVFHDESEPQPGGRWLLIGLLFVRSDHVEAIRQQLCECRAQHGYDGEVHFSALPASFGGQWGGKARVARCWLHSYERSLSQNAYFSALAVDRHSAAYRSNRFTHEFHAYNRFTAMGVKAGISWHLADQERDTLSIRFISDDKDRASRPNRGIIDNFEDYIPYRAQLDAFLALSSGRRYPTVELALELRASAAEDLLQLTDVLLGATQAALTGQARRETKRVLGQIVVRWCDDLRTPPWQQTLGLHRKFSLWAFPDDKGAPYSNVPLALPASDLQGRLEGF